SLSPKFKTGRPISFATASGFTFLTCGTQWTAKPRLFLPPAKSWKPSAHDILRFKRLRPRRLRLARSVTATDSKAATRPRKQTGSRCNMPGPWDDYQSGDTATATAPADEQGPWSEFEPGVAAPVQAPDLSKIKLSAYDQATVD